MMEGMSLAGVIAYLMSVFAYAGFFFFRKDRFHYAGCILIAIGFVLHTTWLGMHSFASGRPPFYTLSESLSATAWAIAGVYLVFQYLYNLKVLGLLAAPFILFIMVVSVILPVKPPEPESIFKGFWLVSHVTLTFLGEAMLALACGIGILYLIQENGIKRKNTGFFYKRLPSLEKLDQAGYMTLVYGFSLLTLGLIIGLIHARLVWGRFWAWDPKEVWSLISWVIYAVLLHERLTVGWRGRKAAILSIVGFTILVFTFIGVNLFMEGHHGAFTR